MLGVFFKSSILLISPLTCILANPCFRSIAYNSFAVLMSFVFFDDKIKNFSFSLNFSSVFKTVSILSFFTSFPEIGENVLPILP